MYRIRQIIHPYLSEQFYTDNGILDGISVVFPLRKFVNVFSPDFKSFIQQYRGGDNDYKEYFYRGTFGSKYLRLNDFSKIFNLQYINMDKLTLNAPDVMSKLRKISFTKEDINNLKNYYMNQN